MFASGGAADPRPALLGVFADCTPDGWGRRLIREALGHAPAELEYLIGVNDFTRQGALRFLDSRGVPFADAGTAVPRMRSQARRIPPNGLIPSISRASCYPSRSIAEFTLPDHSISK